MSQAPLPTGAIAIIGMACRTPGASNIDELWDVIREGRDCITRFSSSDSEDDFDALQRGQPNYVAARAILDDADCFDAARFAMTPREAALTDPQHRVFLEVAQHALEHAGCDPNRYDGLIGVFAGCSMSTYLLRHVLQDRAAVESFASNYQLGMYSELLGGLNDTLATRVAYKLDLKGPAASVQTACSTGLYAVAQAVQALQLYQCDAAIAGGVSITLPQRRGYFHQEGGMGSADGVCRPFDAKANGVVFGSGAGAVVLKRAEDAIADGDQVFGFILGVGVNNDGAQKAAFTAPSASGQEGAIRAALANADVDAADIGYVECHGTATPLGDPIEFEGLRRAYGDGAPCALGSIKANIGHLDAAAGVVGLIKTALILSRRQIPPLTHFTAPNPHIDIASSRFYAPTQSASWNGEQGVRYAGVSSFGVGGTNVHAILMEAPHAEAKTSTQSTAHVQLFPLSGADESAIARQAQTLTRHLEAHDTAAHALGAVAYTLQTARTALSWRAFAVGRDIREARAALTTCVATRAHSSPPVVFLFPGQGAQKPVMAEALARRYLCFREDIEAGLAAHRRLSKVDLRDALFAASPREDVNATIVAQPALYIIEYALGRLLARVGVTPTMAVGHSVGEFAAAALAGVFTFEDGLRLISKRAELMEALPPGAMLAVRAGPEALAPLLSEELEIAALNGPKSLVVSGPPAAIAALEDRLQQKNIAHRRLAAQRAFHSAMMDDAVEALCAEASRISLCAPNFDLVSGVTGKVETEIFRNPTYWGRHAREPVRFGEAIAQAQQAIFLEVGPGLTLGPMARQNAGEGQVIGATGTLGRCEDGEEAFVSACGALWSLGVDIDFHALHDGAPRRTILPGYAYARDRHWIEAPRAQTDNVPQATVRFHSEAADEFEAKPGQSHMIQNRLRPILSELAGRSIDASEDTASFLELGFDSLTLGQVAARVQSEFNIKVSFRQLMNETPSIESLAARIEREAPVNPAPEPAPAIPPTPVAGVQAAGDIAAIFSAQLAAMKGLIDQQNAILGGRPVTSFQAAQAPIAFAPVAAAALTPVVAEPAPNRFRVYSPSAARVKRAMSDAQMAHVRALERAWNAKTPESKRQAGQFRSVMADPRSVSGFRSEWKNLIYPLVVSGAKGAYLTDIDGNEYIDLVNGYGQTMFGHSPDFVLDALKLQMSAGFPIGPQNPLSGVVAERIARSVGMDRVTFCSTGSEAVMAAMRVARCVTGRDRVVVFTNDYHGQFDEVLVKPKGGEPDAAPIAPGIPASALGNMIVLPYGEETSLQWIAQNAKSLAAVIVEPVQSRRPSLQPVAFLKALRDVTKQNETALVFDEVVTGFRVHPGGMQAVWGIKADLATYGKVLGGGLPIGVLAGSAAFMDALDGGAWRFEDDSIPEVAPTFFAGTFVRHPLALAACNASLDHLERAGPGLQSALDGQTRKLADRLNSLFASRGTTLRAEHFSSWLMLEPSKHDPLGGLLFHHLRLRGLHVQENFPCFLTTAHGEREHDAILTAFEEALDALQSVGILGPPEGQQTAVPVKRVAQASVLPLTDSQTEILMAAQFGDQASCAFNEVVEIRLEGDLAHDALQEAVRALCARHESLRAHIDVSGPSLVIEPSVDCNVRVVSVRSDKEAQDQIEMESALPFDLARGPLVRFTLLNIDVQRHILLVAAHHLVCDGWSMNVVCEELGCLYSARVMGAPAELETPGTLEGFRTESPSVEADLAYWKAKLAASPDRLDLPLDRPRARVRAFRGDTVSAHLSKDLLEAARKASAKMGATLFSTLLTALHATLSRLSGQSDIVIGVPFAGQSLTEAKAPIGHFVHFLPLRLSAAANASSKDYVQGVQKEVQAALQHGGVTFGAITRALGLRRDAQRPPLTDVQFNLERFAESATFARLKADLRPGPKRGVVFDLFFNLIESAHGLRVDVDFDSDLFDRQTIEDWIGVLERTIRAIAAQDNAQPLARAAVMSDAQRAWLMARNPPYAPIKKDASIAHVFEDQARRFADRVAIREGQSSLTYRQLQEAVVRAAGALARAGIGAGDRVALITDRSTDAIIAILAILRRGAAFAPLDVKSPRARLSAMVEDCEAKLVLVGSDSEEWSLGVSRSLPLRSLHESGSNALKDDGAPQTSADSPASIMFTSGTTGRPKGAIIPHRAILRLVTRQDFISFGPEQSFLHLAPLSFDASTLEIFGAVLHGGTLVIAPGSEVTLAELESTIASHKVTTAWFTAAMFHAIVDERPRALLPLRQILTGGDVVSPIHVQRAQRAAPNARIVNGYGPTENTTFSACHVFPESFNADHPAPIGVPIGGTRLYVLDDHGELALPGVKGEAFFAGEGLALGYVNRQALSAERFVAAPSAGETRAYRSGDIVSWRKDGILAFHGRRDGQVKINGYRIEPGEIESVLSAGPGVTEAAALVQMDASGASWIECWAVSPAAVEDRPSEAILLAACASRLPSYMMPRRIHIIDAMPRTANGKIDRAALKRGSIAPSARSMGPSQSPSTSPRAESELERSIIGIWQDVLKRSDITASDAIFSLGADSLQIFRIGARFEAAGLKLSARDLLANPTVAELARIAFGEGGAERTAPTLSLASFRRGARRPS